MRGKVSRFHYFFLRKGLPIRIVVMVEDVQPSSLLQRGEGDKKFSTRMQGGDGKKYTVILETDAATARKLQDDPHLAKVAWSWSRGCRLHRWNVFDGRRVVPVSLFRIPHTHEKLDL